MDSKNNIDNEVVEDFGKEWNSFTQTDLSKDDLDQGIQSYFRIFPYDKINSESIGADFGCGSGRWVPALAPHAKKIYCIDPSDAIHVAEKNLNKNFKNLLFEKADISKNSIPDQSLDFGYCLGVLHHIPDTQLALNDCIKKLKTGSPFLLYIYYKFDNQPFWYFYIWKLTDLIRKIICRLPYKIKLFITFFIALLVYFPVARFGKILDFFGLNVKSWPLSDYRNKTFYTMRTDSLDRFGTKLEHRYTKQEIENMMEISGLENIEFDENNAPYWCAVGYKR
ncbi:class I SAM-dependent methyltransferase [Gammaproteobacteria bacterium]|nr:class I SAM-dependent methyltransferase [Gammaproteobacteria bacterium]